MTDSTLTNSTPETTDERIVKLLDRIAKDFSSLVARNIKILRRSGKEDELVDAEGVKAKFGVYPERFIDYLMLVGDSIDDIPGVDGVAHGKASKYLQKYGSLRNMWNHAEELTPALYKNLVIAEKMFHITKKLLTIKTDVAVALEADTSFKPPNTKELINLLNAYGFRSEASYVQQRLYYQPG